MTHDSEGNNQAKKVLFEYGKRYVIRKLQDEGSLALREELVLADANTETLRLFAPARIDDPAGVPFRLADLPERRKHFDQPVSDGRHLAGKNQNSGDDQQRAHRFFNYVQPRAQTRAPAHEGAGKTRRHQER